MFDVDPTYWLIALAVVFCVLTGIVVLASSITRDEDEFAAPRMSGVARDDAEAPLA